ncbi:MAG: DUF4255 domain-containing protein [Bacteroidales bacterium]|nr:DUF4255 domain-containing protein [Bacteroidales bacterium]
MIYESLQLIVKELNNYLNTIENADDDKVVLGNIALIDNHQGNDASNPLVGNIVLTLINIEEEKTLKNLPHYRKSNNNTEYKNPPVHLNMYVLISATSETYSNSLIYLSRIVQFFQGQNVFTPQNSPQNFAESIGLSDFKLILDLYSLSFEESNFLWSTLGGKQYPSVVYRIRLVEIEREQLTESRPSLSETSFNGSMR